VRDDNCTSKGRTQYPVVVDPAMTALEPRHALAAGVYHAFTADRTSAGIGRESDLSVSAALGPRVDLSVTDAAYAGNGLGAGGFKDKRIAWITTSYRR
jgi:hypothetical protein